LKEAEGLSPLEREVILVLQRDLEIKPRPFLELAEVLGVSEEQILEAVRSLMAKGYIRRFGATLRHQLSGFGANALVTWKAPETELERLGERLAGYRQVTHCYARRPTPAWPYNLYTMLHGRTLEEVVELATRMAQEIGLLEYEILFSDVELKKTTMRYFRE
jgi:DNA-binding Lrp family transcriptional regulator